MYHFKLWCSLDICPGSGIAGSCGNSVLLANQVMGMCLAPILQFWRLEGQLWWRQPQDQSLALWASPGSVGCSSDGFGCLDPSIGCVFLTLVTPAELLVPHLPLLVQILRLLGESSEVWSEAPLPASWQFREDPIVPNPKSFFYLKYPEGGPFSA